MIVTITAETPPPEQPESPTNIIAPQGGDPSAWLLSPIGLGIIIGFTALFIIMVAILIKNNKTIKELNQKIGKTPVSKIDSKNSAKMK